MDRNQANSNIRTALVFAGIAMLLFALTFYVAVLWIGS
jgi:hypothetical protein